MELTISLWPLISQRRLPEVRGVAQGIQDFKGCSAAAKGRWREVWARQQETSHRHQMKNFACTNIRLKNTPPTKHGTKVSAERCRGRCCDTAHTNGGVPKAHPTIPAANGDEGECWGNGDAVDRAANVQSVQLGPCGGGKDGRPEGSTGRRLCSAVVRWRTSGVAHQGGATPQKGREPHTTSAEVWRQHTGTHNTRTMSGHLSIHTSLDTTPERHTSPTKQADSTDRPVEPSQRQTVWSAEPVAKNEAKWEMAMQEAAVTCPLLSGRSMASGDHHISMWSERGKV